MLSRLNQIQGTGRPITGAAPVREGNLRFQAGDLFRGTVLRSYPGGEVLVAAGGKEFRARTELHLVEGSTYRFQVKTTGERTELKVLDEGPLRLRSPLHLWVSSRSIRNRLADGLLRLSAARNLKHLPPDARLALRDVHRLLPALIYRAPNGDQAQWVSRFLLGSGLFWENKVARFLLGEEAASPNRLQEKDLKALLLILDRNLALKGGSNQQALGPLSETIREALSLVEQDQFLNLSSHQEDIGWYWCIPGSEDEGFRKAEVFLEREREEEEIRLFMYLDFTRLGEVEAEVCMLGSNLSLRLAVEDEEREAFVSRELPLLGASLQALGLRPTTMHCSVREKRDEGRMEFLEERVKGPAVDLVI
ncbi:MAG: flagellar hook-length control protein FliK [Deltaproteobacteria bacterium]|nr:flagellar hook-length control protein FliK [Deltaproteobacteria bacterium]